MQTDITELEPSINPAEVEAAFAEMGDPRPNFDELMEDPDYLADLEARQRWGEHVAAGHPIP